MPRGPTTVSTDDDVDALVAIFGDDKMLSRPELAKRLGSSLETIRGAVLAGQLDELHVSARRVVVTPAQVRRNLRAVQAGSNGARST